jgi:hypothetical protein
MTIDEFRRAMAYTSIEATEAERREARAMAKAIVARNKELFDRLAEL